MKFLEPSFLVSFYHEKSNKHKEAKKIYKTLNKKDLLISYMVIAEVLTVLRKLKTNNELVTKTYNSMIEDLMILDDTSYYEKSFQKSLTNEIGFFDNLYYIIMKDLKIKEIISFDRDFDIFEDIKRLH
ncbi:MAG: PIN domain-containing protein [Methanobrevibacter sp.]|jgi:predicted nucleic acid-binding protein|nr:PIN domain-containing protein [Candidatus Methanovirga aequatorialis]